MRLSKSDFKLARTCPTKLYYKKLGYPSLAEDNPYLEFLADGGYMVETMARLLYPGGEEMGDWDRPEVGCAAIREAFGRGIPVLFEPTVVHRDWLARIDILRRTASGVEIIEVKSSGLETEAGGGGLGAFRGRQGGIEAGWRPYLEDVAFQTLVVRGAFPDWEVRPFLCVVDKTKVATESATAGKFRLRRAEGAEGAWRPTVEYEGDVEALRRDHLLCVVDVSREVEELLPELEPLAAAWAASVRTEPIERLAPVIGRRCKSCEFRVTGTGSGRNGFRECWGKLGEADPHVLDLYRVDLVGGRKGDPVREMAARGESGLAEVPVELLVGAVAERQRIQLEYTASGGEYLAPWLGQALASHSYPLHFIDFEGSRLAIPYHAGMRPYEQAAFQWSCHTLTAPGSGLRHAEWLNAADAFPNFEFARALREEIGETGTVYIWSPYERVVLREIRAQMAAYAVTDPDLAGWLERMTMENSPRVVDLCALAKQGYFHPAMKGSLSIKYVLPAVWACDEVLRGHPAFTRYVRPDGRGGYRNPYDVLPPLPIGGVEEVVKEGTGAMRVYQDMMFGVMREDPVAREACRKLLLQYCELDTAAMVMIWMHWVRVAAGTPTGGGSARRAGGTRRS